MAHAYVYGGVHPTLQGYARGPGLAGPVPAITLQAQEGVSVASFPVIPAIAAGLAGWLGAKAHPALAVVAGTLAYFGARAGMAAVQGSDARNAL